MEQITSKIISEKTMKQKLIEPKTNETIINSEKNR